MDSRTPFKGCMAVRLPGCNVFSCRRRLRGWPAVAARLHAGRPRGGCGEKPRGWVGAAAATSGAWPPSLRASSEAAPLVGYVDTNKVINGRQAPGSDAESEPNRPPIQIRTLGGRSDPNPDLAVPEPIRIRTASDETDPNPDPECRIRNRYRSISRSESKLERKKRIRTPNPDLNPAKRGTPRLLIG